MLYYIIMPLAMVVWRVFWRIEYIGMDRLNAALDSGRGYVLAPNHRSALDPVFVIVATGRFWKRKMRIFAKKELYQGSALLGWFLDQMGCVRVKTSKNDLDTLDKTIGEVKGGRWLLLFPEGTRSKTGELLPPKSGAFVVADQAAADMLPCRILYDTPDGKMKLFCRVRVIFGEAIPAETLSLGEKRDMRKLRENKKLLTAAWAKLGEEHGF